MAYGVHGIWEFPKRRPWSRPQIVGLFFFRTPTKRTPILWKPPYPVQPWFAGLMSWVQPRYSNSPLIRLSSGPSMITRIPLGDCYCIWAEPSLQPSTKEVDYWTAWFTPRCGMTASKVARRSMLSLWLSFALVASYFKQVSRSILI